MTTATSIGTMLSQQTHADSATQPGSVDDPVVTKSYVDEQIRKLLNGGTTAPTPTPTPVPSATPTVTEAAGVTTAIIKLEPNQTLYVDAGADSVVRTGKVIAFSSDTNGITDATSGKDILPGSSVENNHLLIFPRDGRGLKPDPKFKDEIYIMIRGGYEVK